MRRDHYKQSPGVAGYCTQIGLLLAGCFTMAKGAIFGVETAAIAVGVLLILMQYKVNPALLVLGSAVLGLMTFAPK